MGEKVENKRSKETLLFPKEKSLDITVIG